MCSKGFFAGLLISIVFSLQVAFAVYHIYGIDEYIDNANEYKAMKICREFNSYLIYSVNGVYKCDSGAQFELSN